ncbi:hypothetical protein SETIT_9G288700v2 [Setaria italica]|uniref:Cytochrome P450 n=1 Tax=Setaria italica TaxID=4555 RepID=A0A368SLX6_SETIT|nr:cytochrome P450 76M5 [Setaria italica]RCV43364.1 hypothetical protein SETIT_9G288700v2 [Setaria italica]
MERQLWLLWAALAVPLLYCLTNLRRRLGTGRRPLPGPTPLPLIGNLIDLRRGNLHHTLARLARTHGPVMYLRLGLTDAVVVSSRDAASEAFMRHDRRLAGRAIPDIARALGFSERAINWLPSSDPHWKTLRGVLATHIFSSRALAAARGVRERKVRDLVSYFRARTGQEVYVGRAVYGAMLNLMSSIVFSVDVVADMDMDAAAGSTQGIRELLNDLVSSAAKPNVSDLFPFLRPFDLQGWRRWTAKKLEKFYRFLDDMIDRRLTEDSDSSSRDKHGDFLDVLIQLMSAGKLARGDITSLLFEVFASGTDALVVTVEWTMAELLRNPRVMAKVRAEIQGTLGSKEAIEESDVACLRYLMAVMKEAMRLHPVAPLMLPHMAMEDGVEIQGHAVPKGHTVIFNTWAIMRDPAAWERPNEFIPERFMDRPEMVFKGKEPEFSPFGSGLRLCPAQPMAERVVPLGLASLLHAFEWRLPNGLLPDEFDLSERFNHTNVPAVPLKAVPFAIT